MPKLPWSEPRRRRTLEPTLLFMHIPKSGGTAMVETLSKCYAKNETALVYGGDVGVTQAEFMQLPPERREQLRFVAGHFMYGLHEWLMRPFWHATVVRDPIDRVRSLYDHFRRYVEPGPATAWHRWINAENAGVGRFVREQASNQTDNGMVRMLTGLHPDVGKCTVEMLERAQRRLDTFAAVLVFEELDLGLAPLEAVVGRLPELPRVNVTTDASDLTDDDRTAIREANQLDIALYEHALARWGRRG